MRPLFTPSRPRIERVNLQVELGSLSFPIELCTRKLDLCGGITADYFWIANSELRTSRTKSKPDFSLFEHVLAHHWEAMRLMGSTDEEQLRTLLLASCYPLVSNDKSVQKVYRDAHLGSRRVDPQSASLPDDVRSRIQNVVRRRDRTLLRNELDYAFGMPRLLISDANWMTQIQEQILDHGVGLVRSDGKNGIGQFTDMMDQWIEAYRRRGGDPFKRSLIDHMSYQFKVSFYTCYANLWVTLIDRLRTLCQLDTVSERFLRFWHMQNQPVQLPNGGMVPSVFCGQILALHPLSSFFLMDPGLLAIAGKFFGSRVYNRTFSGSRAAGGSRYWEVLGAIMTAAHLYRQASNLHSERRSKATRTWGGPVGAQDSPRASRGHHPISSHDSPAQIMEDLARREGWACPNCRGALEFRGHNHAAERDLADLRFECPRCRKTVHSLLNFEDLQAALRTDQD